MNSIAMNVRRRTGNDEAGALVARVGLLVAHVMALSFLSLPLINVNAAGFRVVGEMQYTDLRGALKKISEAPNNVAEIRWPFELSCEGHNWLVKVGVGDGQTALLGGDGNSVYQVLVDEPAQKRLKMNSYSGSVFEGNYPVQSFGFNVSLPWLAYCSAPLLVGTTNGSIDLPALWLMAWQDPLAHIYRCSYEPLPGGVGLPGRLAYQVNGDLMSALLQGRFRSMPPLDQGARERINFAISSHYSHIAEPEVVYEVLSLTNFNGTVIPTSFSLTQYAFIESNDTFEKRLSAITFAKAALVEAVDRVDPFPKLSGEVKNIQAADYRFFDPSNRIGYVGYMATNSAWLTEKSDPYLQKLYADAKAKSASGPSFVISKRWKAAFLFLLAISWPLFLRPVRTRIRKALIQQGGLAN